MYNGLFLFKTVCRCPLKATKMIVSRNVYRKQLLDVIAKSQIERWMIDCGLKLTP